VKDLDAGPLFRTLREREARAVVFGAAREAWVEPLRAAGVEVVAAETPSEALDRARELPGSAVLFSPAAASFDAYPNFQARADELLAHAARLGLLRTPPPAPGPA
jgi:UDP-N-acetylmuramoylalanine--D-glutamate ligase